MDINELIDKLLEFDGSDSEVEHFWLEEIKKYCIQGGSLFELSNRNNWQLIHIAALNGVDSVVEWLVEQGVDVNSKDDQGCSPILLAFDLDIDGAIQNNREINFSHSRKLLSLGADPSITNLEGRNIESTALAYGKKIFNLYKTSFVDIKE